MTALPQPPVHLLTVTEYAGLGETESGYTELVEGRLLMSPSPVPDHNAASLEVAVQLRPQVPEHVEVIQDVDVDLELVPPDGPGFSRRPDLMIIQKPARRDAGGVAGVFATSEPFAVRLELHRLR